MKIVSNGTLMMPTNSSMDAKPSKMDQKLRQNPTSCALGAAAATRVGVAFAGFAYTTRPFPSATSARERVRDVRATSAISTPPVIVPGVVPATSAIAGV